MPPCATWVEISMWSGVETRHPGGGGWRHHLDHGGRERKGVSEGGGGEEGEEEWSGSTGSAHDSQPSRPLPPSLPLPSASSRAPHAGMSRLSRRIPQASRPEEEKEVALDALSLVTATWRRRWPGHLASTGRNGSRKEAEEQVWTTSPLPLPFSPLPPRPALPLALLLFLQSQNTTYRRPFRHSGGARSNNWSAKMKIPVTRGAVS